MKKILCAMLLFGAIYVPVLCDGNEISVEKMAYENAVTFLKNTRLAYIANDLNAQAKRPGELAPKYIEGPNDAIWDKNLVVLAQSSSPEGSKYLARLAFFAVDAGGGEDFSCATWKRKKKHSKEFLKYLKNAKNNYETMSPCLAPQFAEEKAEPVLQCISNNDYAKLIQIHEIPESPEEKLEAEADCSHMFKPKTH